MADDLCKEFSKYQKKHIFSTSSKNGKGAVGMYSGIFNNPFMIWGKYKRAWFKTSLTVSFQFHHTQMDGAHASKFLEYIQKEIDKIE